MKQARTYNKHGMHPFLLCVSPNIEPASVEPHLIIILQFCAPKQHVKTSPPTTVGGFTVVWIKLTMALNKPTSTTKNHQMIHHRLSSQSYLQPKVNWLVAYITGWYFILGGPTCHYSPGGKNLRSTTTTTTWICLRYWEKVKQYPPKCLAIYPMVQCEKSHWTKTKTKNFDYHYYYYYCHYCYCYYYYYY